MRIIHLIDLLLTHITTNLISVLHLVKVENLKNLKLELNHDNLSDTSSLPDVNQNQKFESSNNPYQSRNSSSDGPVKDIYAQQGYQTQSHQILNLDLLIQESDLILEGSVINQQVLLQVNFLLKIPQYPMVHPQQRGPAPIQRVQWARLVMAPQYPPPPPSQQQQRNMSPTSGHSQQRIVSPVCIHNNVTCHQQVCTTTNKCKIKDQINHQCHEWEVCTQIRNNHNVNDSWWPETTILSTITRCPTIKTAK